MILTAQVLRSNALATSTTRLAVVIALIVRQMLQVIAVRKNPNAQQ
jgi:hypothetical protein